MENKPKQKLKLLPSYFKLIGLGLLIAAFVPEAIVLLNHMHLQKTGKELVELLTKAVFIIGLLFIASSRDRNEEERLMDIRLRSFISAFLYAVFM